MIFQTRSKADRLYLGKNMIQIAAAHGMTVYSCGEGQELAAYGADCSGCMTKRTYEKALHTTLAIPKKQPLRKACACFMGNDIGAYNTCVHMCRYCYANYDSRTVKQNYAFHDPASSTGRWCWSLAEKRLIVSLRGLVNSPGDVIMKMDFLTSKIRREPEAEVGFHKIQKKERIKNGKSIDQPFQIFTGRRRNEKHRNLCSELRKESPGSDQ